MRAVLIDRFEYNVAESTIHAQLNSLFHLGVVTDHDTPDRECRINGRFKKTWRLVRRDERNNDEVEQ